MSREKQVVSFRGSVADEIAQKILPLGRGVALGEVLFNHIRENADDLTCFMEDGKIVICDLPDV